MENLGRELYDFLKTKEYFNEPLNINLEVEWGIKAKCNYQTISNLRILGLLKDKDERFLNLCKQYNFYKLNVMTGTLEEELKTIPYVLVTSNALAQYETMKRVFCFALDFKKIDPKLNDKSTYGAIITRLECNGLENPIVNALDNQLRNIVAHGDWYLKDDQFVYRVNNEYKSMSYEALSQRVENFTEFSNAFVDIYWRNHIPDDATKFAMQKKRDDYSDLV